MDDEQFEEAVEDILEDGGITLVVTDAENYMEDNRRIIRRVTASGLPGIYLTVNKPYGVMREYLEGVDVDTSRIFFIDAVSQEAGIDTAATDEDNVMFLESPRHLTDISIVLGEANKQFDGKKFVFFDSMSILSIYNDPEMVSKFAHYLTGKLRSWDVVGIIISVHDDMDDRLLTRLHQFCDTRIDLRSTG